MCTACQGPHVPMHAVMHARTHFSEYLVHSLLHTDTTQCRPLSCLYLVIEITHILTSSMSFYSFSFQGTPPRLLQFTTHTAHTTNPHLYLRRVTVYILSHTSTVILHIHVSDYAFNMPQLFHVPCLSSMLMW